MQVLGELGGCGCPGALLTTPGDVDVQTLFREIIGAIVSLVLY